MNIKSILPVTIAVAAVIAFGFQSFKQDSDLAVNEANQPATEQVTGSVTTAKNAQSPTNQTTPTIQSSTIANNSVNQTNAEQSSPNFDRRSMVAAPIKSTEPMMSSAQSSQIMAEKQVEMEKLVALYNNALSDSKRKADIERKFKLHMEDYKLALIAKVQRGEL